MGQTDGILTEVPANELHQDRQLYWHLSAWDYRVACLLFVLTCFYLYLFHDYTNFNADEGIVLQGAQRILRGEVLYRDFFAFVTPGSYYWMASLFRVFGSSILVARAALVVYGGLFSVLTYLLARRVCSSWSAVFVVYIVALTCLPFRFIALHNWDSTLLAYVSLYCAVLWLERSHWIWALLMGTFAAFTFLFEQSKGVGLILGLVAGLSVIAIRGHFARIWSKRHLVATIVGFVWPVTLTLAYFASRRSMTVMLADCAWPLFHYSLANKLPYGYLVLSSPGQTWLTGSWGIRLLIAIAMGPFILLPLVPIVAAATLVWSAVTPGPVDRRRAYWVLISAVLSGLLVSTLLTKRADFTHLNYIGPLLYLPLAWCLDGFELRHRFWAIARPVAAFVAFFTFTAFGLAILSGNLSAQQRLATARGKMRAADSAAFEYIRANVRPGEEILVYPYQPLYYYLTATYSPTRFEFLQPGMHSSAQFTTALHEIATHQPRVVLFETSFYDKVAAGWPNTPLAIVAARDPIQDYLFANYQPCRMLRTEDFWHFAYMVPKIASCPPGDVAGDVTSQTRRPKAWN